MGYVKRLPTPLNSPDLFCTLEICFDPRLYLAPLFRKGSPVNKPVVAVIFDFDDTLTNDTTSALLVKGSKGAIKPKKFWEEEVDRLVREEGWEPTNAWLHLLLKYMEENRLPRYTKDELKEFGKSLTPYPSLPSLFRDLRKIASTASCDIEFYIISGGIEDIVEGFKYREEFTAVWGSRLAPEKPAGPVKYIQRAISFTEKTRYIYAINKGIDLSEFSKNPARVNDFILEANRRVPLANMVYIGDGLSDIPCFSLIEPSARKERTEKHTSTATAGARDEGFVVPVFQPNSAKWAWEKLIFPGRIPRGPFDPLYGKNRALGQTLRNAVATICAGIKLRRV